MEEKEYMRIHVKHFPQDIRDQYNINNIVHTNNFVYIRINKGMYGLKQAAVLASTAPQYAFGGSTHSINFDASDAVSSRKGRPSDAFPLPLRRDG